MKHVDLYLFPCRGKDPTTQVNELVSALSGVNYGIIWIDIEENLSPSCSWSGHTSASNCQFIIDVAKAIKAHSKVPGIYASAHEWSVVLGSTSTCKEAAKEVPALWYAHYDNKQTFADFSPFGGWTTPNVKQYLGTSSECGASIDKNWYP